MFTIRPTGQRAVGWMMTVYPLMGERRREAIRRVLVDWRSRPVVNAIKTSCLRGHPFDAENTYQYKANHRMCKQCARIRGRAYANNKHAAFIGPHRRAGRPVAA